MKTLIRIFFLTICVALMHVEQARACFGGGGVTEVGWDGSESSDWNDPDNYSTGDLPDTDEIVVVNADYYSNAPIISSTSAFTPYAIQLDNDGLLTVNADVSTGDIQIEDGNSNSLIVNSGATLSLSDDIYFYASGGLNISGDGDIEIGGNILFDETNGTITNNLTGDFTIAGDLVFESSNGTFNNNGNINIGGDLTTSGIAITSNDVNNNTTGNMTVDGNINFNGAANDVVNEGIFTLNGSFLGINIAGVTENRASGTWIWNYTGSTWDLDILSVFVDNGTFSYQSGSDQNIIPLPYTDLTIAGAGTKSVVGDINVSGTLTLSSGFVSLGDNDLTISSTGVISGGSAASFVLLDGDGALIQENLGSGGRTGDVVFPVGVSSTSYTPLTINNTTGTADDFSVSMVDAVYEDGTWGSEQTSDVVDRTWYIDEAVAGGSDASLTFQWSSSEGLGGFDPASLHVIHYNGSEWERMWSGAATGSGPYTATCTGINDFSPFGIEGDASPLPVELVSFTAKSNNNTVEINWITSSELNNDYFVLEKSLDLENFEQVAKVDGNGTTNEAIRYRQIDMNPYGGMSYYRLTQVDFDGTTKVYKPIQVNVSLTGEINAYIYPMPSNGENLNIQITGYDKTISADLKIVNIKGEVMYLEEVVLDKDTGYSKNLSFANPLPPGMYVLNISTPQPITERILIK